MGDDQQNEDDMLSLISGWVLLHFCDQIEICSRVLKISSKKSYN